jgi:hypothetical protein
MRGVLRTIEREARRRQRELERQQKEYNKLVEIERASYEVELYENKLAVLQSMHQDCSEARDWEKIRKLKAPSEPTRKDRCEKIARTNFQSYRPTFFQKLFGKVEKIRRSLELEIENGIKKDEKNYLDELKKHNDDKKEWEENITLANKIIEGNLDGYKEAYEKLNPLSEISEIGTSLNISFPNKDMILVDLNVHSDELIPNHIKSLLKSGKLSIKPMPMSKFNEIYQDHICSSVLRIARESFAVLPIKKILVTAYGNLLNTQTGNKEDVPILSVLIPNETLNKLNFDSIDPSDSMRNFVHNMNFKKTTGFNAVERLQA